LCSFTGVKALLVIDMQLGSFRPYSLRHDTMGVVGRINQLSQLFRSKGDKVIFIQHDGSKEQQFIPGAADWQLLQELEVQPSDILVSKTVNDSFYNTTLEQTLRQHGVTELFITGCATDFCVDTTIKSAFSKDYSITVIADGHTTADRPGMDAASVITYFNWLWADMTPTKSAIKVVDCATAMNSL
jgi:nicotinamidase-related amidase